MLCEELTLFMVLFKYPNLSPSFSPSSKNRTRMISMAIGSIFKLDDQTTKIPSMESKAIGLKIITTKTPHLNCSKPIFQRNQIPSSSSCFLKSCFLCHKHLSLNKEVYMYRGDQSFCSEECRSRQIYIDDLKQLEISTKKRIQHFRRSSRASRVFCL